MKKRVFLPVAGFTFVEGLISVLILGLLMGGIVMVLKTADMSWHSESGLLDLAQEARQAMDGMIREMRQGNSNYVIISNAGARIEFKIPTDITAEPVTYSDNIAYYLSGSQIIREYPLGTTKVLANNISSLIFSQSADTVGIALTASKDVRERTFTFSLEEKIRLRNG